MRGATNSAIFQRATNGDIIVIIIIIILLFNNWKLKIEPLP